MLSQAAFKTAHSTSLPTVRLRLSLLGPLRAVKVKLQANLRLYTCMHFLHADLQPTHLSDSYIIYTDTIHPTQNFLIKVLDILPSLLILSTSL